MIGMQLIASIVQGIPFMMGQTHAFIAMVPAVLMYWKVDGGISLNHGRFMLFALFSGLIIDLDFIAGMLQLVCTNSVPDSLSELINIGRQAHPFFTHHAFTFFVALACLVTGLLAFLHATHVKQESGINTPFQRKWGWLATIALVASVALPILFLQIPTRDGWLATNNHVWQQNITITIIILCGLGSAIILNFKRPAHLFILGAGIVLHLACDVIQYWVLVLGPFDPAWFTGEIPMMLSIALYNDSDLLAGAIVEGPSHIFFLAYVVWYVINGRHLLMQKRNQILTVNAHV